MNCFICAQCGTSFMAKEKNRKFCSLACVRIAGNAKLADLFSKGEDPRHGRPQRASRQADWARRRQTKEHYASHLVKHRDRVKAFFNTIPYADGRPVAVPDQSNSPGHTHYFLDGEGWSKTADRWQTGLKETNVRTLAGFGCGLRVDKDALILKDGHVASSIEPTEQRLYRAVHGVETIVVLGESGNITLAALQWCQDQGISVLMLNREGHMYSLVSPSARSTGLRRLQYQAEPLPMSRKIVLWKLSAQAQARPACASRLADLRTALHGARSVEEIRQIEAQAAKAYWDAWFMDLKWVGKDIPPHWQAFNVRVSPISSSGGRHAAHPVNAVLNYGYTIAAGQLERSLLIGGFDVAAGTLHVEREGRASLVYDLIEPLRPQVENQVLSWIAETKWRRADFVVDRRGVVRLHPQLARIVVQKADLPDTAVGEVIDWYGEALQRRSYREAVGFSTAGNGPV